MALPPLPDGFVLDKPTQTQAASVPPLPDGFTLDKNDSVEKSDPYETARQNLQGFEQRVAQGQDVKDEDFLKPASEGGTKEFWAQKGRRYGSKLAGLTDIGGIVGAVKEAGKGLIGQGQEAVDEINKKVYGDDTQQGEGLTGLAKGIGSFATGASVGGIVRAGQFMSNLAQDIGETVLPGSIEAKNELRRMKERTVAEEKLSDLKGIVGSPKMFDVGAFAGEQALATKVPVLESVAPRLIPQGALLASDLAEGAAGVGSKAAGYGLKAIEKTVGTPEGRSAVTLLSGHPYIAAVQYGLEKGGKKAGGLPSFGGYMGPVKVLSSIAPLVGDWAASKLEVPSEILSKKPIGMTYREFAREIAPQKLEQLTAQIDDLEPAVQGGSSEAFFKSQKAQAQKASWESANTRAQKGDGWNDWFWNQTRNLINTGTNVASNIGQAGLMTASAMPASDEDALTKGIGTAALIAGPMGILGAKGFGEKVNSERFAQVGKKIRGSNPELDAISQSMEKDLSPNEAQVLEKLKGQIAAAGGKDLDGNPIEVYLLPKDKYTEVLSSSGVNPETAATFNPETGRMYVDASQKNLVRSIAHDGGDAINSAFEAFDKSLVDNLKGQLENDLSKNPKAWDQFKSSYESQLGKPIDNDVLFREWISEVKRHIDEGMDLSTMEVPDSLKQVANGSIYKVLQSTGIVPPSNIKGSEFGTPQVSSAIKSYKKMLDTLRPKQLIPRTIRRSTGEVRTPAEDIQMANDAWSRIKDTISKVDEPGYGAIETAIGEVSKKIGSSEIGLPQEINSSLERQFSLPKVSDSAKTWWNNLGPMGKKQLAYELSENHATINKSLDNWRKLGDQRQIVSPDTAPIVPGDPMASLVSKLRGNATPGKMKNPALRSTETAEIFNVIQDIGEDVANKSVLEVLDESNKSLADNELWKSLNSGEKMAFSRAIKANPKGAHNAVFGMGNSDGGSSVLPSGPDMVQAIAPETTQVREVPNIRVQEGEGRLANIEQFFTPSGMTKVTSERAFDKKTNTVTRRPVKQPYLIGRGLNRRNPEEMAVLNRAAKQSGNPEAYTNKVAEIEGHINSGQYLDIDYNSAENSSSGVPSALERREAQTAAEKGTGSRKIAQKFIIPENIRETQGGELTLQGYSIDKVLANNKKTVEALNNAQRTLGDSDPSIQEQLSRVNDYLSGEDWKMDLRSKNENNTNGYRSDGQIFLEPVLDAEGNITGARDANALTRNPNYNPIQIDDWKIQALNLMEGGPSKTYFQEAQVNIPGTGRAVNLPMESANPLLQTLDRLGDSFYVDRGGKKISGVKNVIEPASETLRIDRIDSIKPITKNLQVSPGSYKQRAAGFIPNGSVIAPLPKKAQSFAAPALIAPPARLYRSPSTSLRKEEDSLAKR